MIIKVKKHVFIHLSCKQPTMVKYCCVLAENVRVSIRAQFVVGLIRIYVPPVDSSSAGSRPFLNNQQHLWLKACKHSRHCKDLCSQTVKGLIRCLILPMMHSATGFKQQTYISLTVTGPDWDLNPEPHKRS